MPKKSRESESELNFADLGQQFVDLLAEVCVETGAAAADVFEFIERELRLGITLSLPQQLILRLFYNLPLEGEFLTLAEHWRKGGVCTYHESRKRNVLCLESGRRSGKTLLASIICAYEFYRLCQLENPQQHYNIAWNTEIAMLVIATSATQGERTIFSSVAKLIETSPYFRSLLQRRELTLAATKVVHHGKRVAIYSGNSKSASQVGGTLKGLFLDEVARFRDVDGNSNAIELWQNLGASTLTFRDEALLVAISSAWYEGDAIQQLREQNAPVPSAVTVKAASWDLNPVHASRDNPIVVLQYQSDPRKAALEYEGVRPAADDPFLDADEVRRAVRGLSVVQCQRTRLQVGDGGQLVALDIREVKPFTGATVLHIDPAIVSDGYALAFGHAEEGAVHIDDILVWEPDVEVPVAFDNVEDAILAIHRQRPLTAVTADHYASPQTIQRLRMRGIYAETVFFSSRLQLQMYELVRHLLHQDQLILPCDSPWTALMIRELTRVQLRQGKRIDHPKGESKDVADAIAGVCWRLQGKLFAQGTHLKPQVGTFNPRPRWSSGNAREVVLQTAQERRREIFARMHRKQPY